MGQTKHAPGSRAEAEYLRWLFCGLILVKYCRATGRRSPITPADALKMGFATAVLALDTKLENITITEGDLHAAFEEFGQTKATHCLAGAGVYRDKMALAHPDEHAEVYTLFGTYAKYTKQYEAPDKEGIQHTYMDFEHSDGTVTTLEFTRSIRRRPAHLTRHRDFAPGMGDIPAGCFFPADLLSPGAGGAGGDDPDSDSDELDDSDWELED